MKREVIISGLLSLITIVGIYFYTGYYYEFYEVWNAYLNQLGASSQGILESMGNDTFVSRQILMLIQKIFPYAEVNSWAYITCLFLGLWSISYSILKLVSTRVLAYGLILNVFLLLSESIIIIHTSRISFILALGAMLMLQLFHQSKQKRYLFLFFFMVLLSVFNRIEIGAVAFLLGAIVFFLTNQRGIYYAIPYQLHYLHFHVLLFSFGTIPHTVVPSLILLALNDKLYTIRIINITGMIYGK